MGEITARLADRVEELESKAYELAGEEFMLGSTQQVARILFEAPAHPGRKEDRVLDRHASCGRSAASTRSSA
jgi:DNA polymerase I-like protein with 3'-5' exonuclease and polymerase domains